jgi:hypothetical protein
MKCNSEGPHGERCALEFGHEGVCGTRAVKPTRKLCYLAHPLGQAGDREQNRRNAGRILAQLQTEEPTRVFVASWITLAEYWSETPAEREAGLHADLALIEHCDEIWLCGNRISPGMQIELEHARKCGLRVVDRTYTLERRTVAGD